MRGKDCQPAAIGKRRQDHPRLCGEKFKIAFVRFALSGSPPPMRGKARLRRRSRGGVGITPAYAGKSQFWSSLLQSMRDHPRLCGEKKLLPCWMPARTGSPPPMRGKVESDRNTVTLHRITPAYAGKRPCGSLSISRTRDHPRLCGEKFTVAAV